MAVGRGATVGATDQPDTTPTAGTGIAGIAIGSYVDETNLAPSVLADYGIAMGTNAAVASGATNSVAIGFGTSAKHANAVAIGSNSATSEANSVSVGASTSSTRTITNVTAGDFTKYATSEVDVL